MEHCGQTLVNALPQRGTALSAGFQRPPSKIGISAQDHVLRRPVREGVAGAAGQVQQFGGVAFEQQRSVTLLPGVRQRLKLQYTKLVRYLACNAVSFRCFIEQEGCPVAHWERTPVIFELAAQLPVLHASSLQFNQPGSLLRIVALGRAGD